MKFCRLALQLAALGALILTLLLLLGRFHWALELLTHFRLPCALSFAILSLLLLLVKAFKTSSAILICLLLQLIPLSRHYLPFLKDQEPGIGPSLKLITFNILTVNQKHQEVITFIKKEKPDLICLQETSQEWVNALSSLQKDYPFFKAHPRSNNTGLLLLSKLPLLEAKIVNDPELGNPYMTSVLDWQGQKITLLHAHPYPPMNQKLCLLYTSPSPRDQRGSRMPSSA